ncbi:MAG: nitroreductase family protein [Patescibacteria group bacterium]|nr:nitroreductase family protein [Patescibacteria group bacterium]
MNIEEVIKKRCSIRNFLEKEVKEEKIQKILELINLAPSAGNLQAYKIFIIKDKEKIEKLSQIAYGMSQFQTLPPLIFVFCANTIESSQRYGARGKNLYAIQDTTIACAYAQLIIASLGLGSCWVGAFNEKTLKKFLKTDLLPIAVLPIGYPAENPSRKERKKLEELIIEF